MRIASGNAIPFDAGEKASLLHHAECHPETRLLQELTDVTPTTPIRDVRGRALHSWRVAHCLAQVRVSSLAEHVSDGPPGAHERAL